MITYGCKILLFLRKKGPAARKRTVLDFADRDTPVEPLGVSPQSDKWWPTSAFTFIFGRNDSICTSFFPWPTPWSRFPCRLRRCCGTSVSPIVLLHTKVIRISMHWEFLTRHVYRPLEPILLHNGYTTISRPLTNTSASWQWYEIVFYANRCVHRTQKEFKIWRTVDLHKRPKLVNFKASFLLRVVIEFIRHRCQVIADSSAHWNGDLLAP
jgi:hypothetical protein